jgi:outer membrane autotransporter protein
MGIPQLLSRRSAPTALAAACLLAGHAPELSATDISWDAGTATWFDTANWNPAQLPVAGDDVHIDNGGTAQVDAAGAVGDELRVGENATGFLEIDASGTLAVTQTHIGLVAGSSGEVTVTGGAWTNSSILRVGDEGTGTLTVQAGGQVSSANGIAPDVSAIGRTATAAGIATVTGSGSAWDINGELRVGDSGDGTLTISAGGEVTAVQSLIGTFGGSTGTATVTGADSAWLHSGSINVGREGDGTLLITAGGEVSNTLGTIGELAGGMGEVTVTGSGSTWTNSDALRVGNAGDGTLVISAGGQVSSTGTSSVGNLTGSGTVTVTGTDSAWSLDELRVGGSGDGALTISAGGEVSAVQSLIGTFGGSTGTALVTGTGSNWTHSGSINVGREGTGTLTIEDGGEVSNTQATLGELTGGNGAVTVTGVGSSWQSSGQMRIGFGSNGTLDILAGASVSNTDSTIGRDAAATGAVLVSGAGSEWTNNGFMFVGESGTGTLTIEDGAAVEATGNVTVAVTGTALGTLNLAGTAGSEGALEAPQVAAGAGTAALNFDGGLLRLTGDQANLFGGFAAGEIQIEAGGAFIDVQNFDVATSAVLDGSGVLSKTGTGTLALSGASTYTGGTVLDGGTLRIGHDDALGTGALTILGSTVDYADGVDMGNTIDLQADATLNVDTGSAMQSGAIGETGGPFSITKTGDGTLSLTAANTWTGGTTVNFGTLAVDGGSITHAAEDLVVGNVNGDDGTLTIRNGGAVSNFAAAIGSEAGSMGAVTVTGTGAVWTTNEALRVGRSGNGTLTISDGGMVNTGAAFIGLLAGGTGAVTVTGAGSTWTIAGNPFVVGSSGTGSLTIVDGGAVNMTGSGNSTIGGPGGTGAVTVTGAGSTWTNAGNLFVGTSGTGTLTLADGGAASGAVTLGVSVGGSGTLNIGDGGAAGILDTATVNGGAGTAILNFNHTDADYFFTNDGTSGGTAVAITGSIALNHLGTGTTTLTGANTYSGGTTISAGTLIADNTTGSATGSGAVTVENGGTLAGGGFLSGAVTVDDGGVLAPGTSPGTLSIGELILNNASVLEFELDTPAGTPGVDSDLVDVVANLNGSGSTGNLTLDGILNVTDLGGFATDGSQRLFNYGGALTDNGLLLGTGFLAGYNYTVDTATVGQVNLVVDFTGLQFWDGTDTAADGTVDGGTAAWDGAAGNWTNAGGNVNAAWADLTAVFAGAAGTVEVDGSRTISGLQFVTDGYLLEDTDADGVLALSAGGADLRSNAAVTATVDVDLTGTGTLTKTGAGTIILTGGNDYSGGTLVMDGVLQGNTASLPGDILNNAAVAFDQSADGSYTGVMSGTGALTKIGAGTLILTGANTYSGGTTVNAGTLAGTTTSLQGGIVNNAAVRFDQSTAGTYAGVMSGTGTLSKTDAGTLTLTGANTYTGATTVMDGTLAVNGSIVSATTVNASAVLGGSGAVGNVILNGGTFAPGNSIGTIVVNGNVDFSGGGIYEVEVNAAGQSDLIDATGTATLAGGSVSVLPEPGSYNLSAEYLILSADGGLAGEFDAVTSSLTFLSPELDYDANNVFLTLSRSDVSFLSVALTPNQRAVAAELDAIDVGVGGDFQQVLDALFLLDPAAARAAFDRLSGVPHTHGLYVARQALRGLQRLSFGRLGGGGRNPGLSGLTLALSDEPWAQQMEQHWLAMLDGAGEQFQNRGLWVRGYGVWGDIDGDGNAAGADYDTAGLALGLDAEFGEHWTAGVSGGYAGTDTDSFDGELDGDTFQLAGYAGFNREAWYAHGFIGYAWHDVDSTRDVSFGGFASVSEADYDMTTFSAALELGYDFQFSGQTTLTPFAAFDYAHSHRDSFTESGPAGLAVDSETADSLRPTFGLRLAHTLIMGTGAKLEPVLYVAYAREVLDSVSRVQGTFATAAADGFIIDGPETDRNRFLAGAAINTALTQRALLTLAWDAELTDSDTAHVLSATFRYRW